MQRLLISLALLFQLTVSRYVRRIVFEEYDSGSLLCQFQQMSQNVIRHQMGGGYDQRFVTGFAGSDELSVFETGAADKVVRDIVSVISAVIDTVDGIYKFRGKLGHVMNAE